MAKDRANNPKRKFDTDSLNKMGSALGWSRTSSQGVERAHRTPDKETVAKGYHAKDSFTPGAGHVDDEGPHKGWLGIGGKRD